MNEPLPPTDVDPGVDEHTHQGATEHGDRVFLSAGIAQRGTERRSVPKVYAAIAKAMTEIGKIGVGKFGTNTDQNYRFRSIDDVYGAVNAGLSAAGLVILPVVVTRDKQEHKTNSGKVNWLVTLKMVYTFVCAEDGSSHEVGPFFGEAYDTGDKATNKALTAAFKYMLIEVFCIPMKGIDDADAHTPEEVEPTSTTRSKAAGRKLDADHGPNGNSTTREPIDQGLITPEQVKDLEEKLVAANIKPEIFIAKAGIYDLKDLPTASLAAGIAWIERNKRPAPQPVAAPAEPELPLETAPTVTQETGPDPGLAQPQPAVEPEARTYGVTAAGSGAIVGTIHGKKFEIGQVVDIAGKKFVIEEMKNLDGPVPVLIVHPAGAPANTRKAKS